MCDGSDVATLRAQLDEARDLAFRAAFAPEGPG